MAPGNTSDLEMYFIFLEQDMVAFLLSVGEKD